MVILDWQEKLAISVFLIMVPFAMGKKALGRAIAAVPVLAKCTRTISMNNYPLKRFVGWQNREIKKPCTSSISVLPT